MRIPFRWPLHVSPSRPKSRYNVRLKTALVLKQEELLVNLNDTSKDAVSWISFSKFESCMTNLQQMLMQPVNYLKEASKFNRYIRYGEAINHWVGIPEITMAKINEISDIFYASLVV
jgi:hypothetical protein